MATIETVKILNQTGDGPVIINLSDFNPAVHQLWTDPKPEIEQDDTATEPNAKDLGPEPKKKTRKR